MCNKKVIKSSVLSIATGVKLFILGDLYANNLCNF